MSQLTPILSWSLEQIAFGHAECNDRSLWPFCVALGPNKNGLNEIVTTKLRKGSGCANLGDLFTATASATAQATERRLHWLKVSIEILSGQSQPTVRRVRTETLLYNSRVYS